MDATNVIIGSGKMYVAPIGTTLPTLDGTVYPVVWPAGWREVGYTDDGVELQYNPTFKDITVDEELAPVQIPLTAEKATLVAKLAEATLLNMNMAIAASLYSKTTGTYDVDRLDVGSGTSTEVMVGFEGPAPGTGGLTRVLIGYRAKNTASVATKAQRTDKVVMAVALQLIADSTKAAGKRLYFWVDLFSAGNS